MQIKLCETNLFQVLFGYLAEAVDQIDQDIQFGEGPISATVKLLSTVIDGNVQTQNMILDNFTVYEWMLILLNQKPFLQLKGLTCLLIS